MKTSVRAIVIRDDKILLMYRNKFGTEYYTFIGGGVEPGETRETAVKREVMEESGYRVEEARQVFIVPANDNWGPEYFFVCRIGGNDRPKLAPDTTEAQEFASGNQHTPMWVSVNELANLVLYPERMDRIIGWCMKYGFPEEPIGIDTFLHNIEASKE